MPHDLPPPWTQDFWDAWCHDQQLSVDEEGEFMLYLEQPGHPQPTTYADMDAAYAAFRRAKEGA